MLYKANQTIEGEYDVIVVGSGLAGMTAANKLGKNGRKVLLLESHNKLGGFATWFKRNSGDHIFDISLHGFPVGMIKTCRKYWSREIADLIVPLKRVRFVNPQFEVETDFTKEHFTKILIEKFQVEAEVVDNFFNHLAAMNFYDENQMTNGELFEKFFPGRPDITRFLLEPITYANGSTLEDPAITYGIVFSNFMNKGVYTFCGGTDQLISKMKDELLKNGVDIKLHTKVERIVIKDGITQGVDTGKQEVRGKAVLSNANLLSTINQMVGNEHFSSEYQQKAAAVRLNTSSAQVYMGIKQGESIPDIGDLIFYSVAPTFNTDQLLSTEITSQTFSVYYPKTRPHLNDRYSIVSSTNARYEDWQDLSPEQYQKRKERMIEYTLQQIEKLIPGIRQKIDFTDASTPLTIERYTHHQHGSSFGTKLEGLDVSMKMHQEIKGLFHSGSVGIIMSGWLGAANYGVIQSHQVESYLDQV
ncbi:MAG: FAD-dependent oxidoreductase [Bdellovibrionales bacterium]|jgi:phytoene dehydrogenase-like protein|nr:FAD-dependent oxidoreductase [Bdellovibrionales bacterium]MBT3525821.1 FAD-dependent oxidoreductase [Bdellovibrionales bacterium]MBT7669720.1 FAD-dependent oxidoreductase [Bdellovibrionales bacterium]MBT7767378.1 FAD-dependent oxidoreductase [Bdellovibrionales bacterium]